MAGLRCPTCDYDLTGHDGADPIVCPECGNRHSRLACLQSRICIELRHRVLLVFAGLGGLAVLGFGVWYRNGGLLLISLAPAFLTGFVLRFNGLDGTALYEAGRYFFLPAVIVATAGFLIAPFHSIGGILACVGYGGLAAMVLAGVVGCGIGELLSPGSTKRN